MKGRKRVAFALTSVFALLMVISTLNLTFIPVGQQEPSPPIVSQTTQTESENADPSQSMPEETQTEAGDNNKKDIQVQTTKELQDTPEKSNDNTDNKGQTTVTHNPVKGAQVLEDGQNEDGTSKSMVVYDSEGRTVLYDEKSDIYYVGGIIIVFFERGTSNERRLEIIETIDGKCVGYMDAVNQWQVEIEEMQLDEIEEKSEQLLKFDEVVYARYESANKITTCVIPDDPFGNYYWNENAPSGHNWGQEAIQLPSAWDYDEYFNSIAVGIVDDGFYTGHEELDGIVDFPSVEAEQQNIKAMHGSHIAGIIGAKANNQVGIAGVLWDTTIYAYDYLPVSSAGQDWETNTAIYAGLVDCVGQGAKAVNFSVGLSVPAWQGGLTQAKIAQEAETASIYMAQLLNAGYDFIVVQSAGNGNTSYESLDAINNGMFCCVTDNNTGQSTEMAQMINDRIVIVGCAQNTGNNTFKQAYFSNSGEQVDLCAPGYGIYSCDAYDEGDEDENPYINLAGTSQAAAFVTGVTALTWSVNSSLTGEQIRSIICDSENQPYTADYNTLQNHPLELSYGMVNAKLCVEDAVSTLPADYTEVDNAIAQANSIDEGIYTQQSIQALNSAISSVETGLSVLEQNEVDQMAQNILDALSQLVLKDADYSGVDNALAQAEGIEEIYYTVESVDVLHNATESIVRGLTILEQDLVDDMETSIINALNGLVAKTELIVPEGSTAVVNEEMGLIYGLDYNLTLQQLESEYILVPLNCSLEYDFYSLGNLGTGAVVKLIDDSTSNVIAQYSIVIIGDIDGDGNITTSDTTYITSVVAKLDTIVEDSPFWYAADIFRDSDINTADVTALSSAVAHLTEIDQNVLG